MRDHSVNVCNLHPLHLHATATYTQLDSTPRTHFLDSCSKSEWVRFYICPDIFPCLAGCHTAGILMQKLFGKALMSLWPQCEPLPSWKVIPLSLTVDIQSYSGCSLKSVFRGWGGGGKTSAVRNGFLIWFLINHLANAAVVSHISYQNSFPWWNLKCFSPNL